MPQLEGDFLIRSPYSDVTIPNLTVDELVWQNVNKWADKTAVECGKTGHRLSYRELRNRSKNLARNLSSVGLSKGTVLIVLPNCVEYPIAVLGMLEAGVTVSGANPLYTPGELKSQAEDCGAELVITTPELVEKIRSTGLRVPILCTGEDCPDRVYSFQQMTEGIVDSEPPPREERLRQIAFLPYSSGTTGLPKGVMLSHRNVVANIKQMCHPELCNIRETTREVQDTLPAVMPFFHIYGLVLIMLRGLSLGTKLVTLPSFNSPAFMKILRSNKDMIVMVVPPIISFLANRSEVQADDLESVRYTITGGAPCNMDDLQRLYKKKQHPINQGYGMTEAAPGLTFPSLNHKDPTNVGYVLPNTLACVLDPETGKPLPRGSQGELCFKGPQMMVGYHRRPEVTAETVDSEGWLHTGDIGYVDNEGQFYILDRSKELIKVKGFQVAPAELEGLLCQHPSIADAGVTWLPSFRLGEVPIAFIVPKTGLDCEEEAVLKWLEAQIAPYKKPAKIIVTNEIPRSPSGKILRRKLKESVRHLKLD